MSIIGIYNYHKSNYPIALDYFQKSLKVFEEIGDKKGVAVCLNVFGIVYDLLGNYPKALEYYQKSLKIREKIGDK